MQKEWRVDVRGDDLLPPLGLHHPGHPGGSTPFLAPQPLQGPSKPEPRPLPPAPGPPAPTFRYHWYISTPYIFLHKIRRIISIVIVAITKNIICISQATTTTYEVLPFVPPTNSQKCTNLPTLQSKIAFTQS